MMRPLPYPPTASEHGGAGTRVLSPNGGDVRPAFSEMLRDEFKAPSPGWQPYRGANPGPSGSPVEVSTLDSAACAEALLGTRPDSLLVGTFPGACAPQPPATSSRLEHSPLVGLPPGAGL